MGQTFVTDKYNNIWDILITIQFSFTEVIVQSAKVKIHSLVAMSGKASEGKCLHTDFAFLESFAVPAHYRIVKEIIPMVWKAPTSPWLKVNTDGSVIDGHAAYGRYAICSIAFVCNIGAASVFHSEVLAFILAMEHAANHGWRNVWSESDSSSAILIFSNPSLVPLLLRNRWHNTHSLGIQIIASHIFREGNCCADRLANMGHDIQGSVWISTLQTELHLNFFRDRVGLPNYRFP